MGLILRVLAVSLSAITLACGENYHSGLKWILDFGGVRGSRKFKCLELERMDGGVISLYHAEMNLVS